tara:strand:+ start:580 stop:1758 length:1179 start_codon:yes stop_codon:yes gene_type:complete
MITVLIVAAGQGTRMNSDVNKTLIELDNNPIIYHTIKSFQDCDEINQIIIITRKQDIEQITNLNKKHNFSKIIKIVQGGNRRQDSVYKGFIEIPNPLEKDTILIHNGCNPFIEQKEITDCINNTKQFGASVCAFQVKDTIKKVNNLEVEQTIDRSNLWQMQTPQGISYKLLKQAFENAIQNNLEVTDDASLVEQLGIKPRITKCSYKNIKITTPEDLEIAKGILSSKNKSTNPEFRVGLGQDSHKFSTNPNKKLTLAGTIIENHQGLAADSDGDVILHALFNSLSSTIGDHSLGFYADDMYKKGIKNSKEYLKVILNKIQEKNLRINNLSISIEAKTPKLEPHSDSIKDSLSTILNISKDKIGLTFTSGDSLTSFGKGEGVQCLAIVSLFSI